VSDHDPQEQMPRGCPWCEAPATLYTPFPGADNPRYNIECQHQEDCPITLVSERSGGDIMYGWRSRNEAKQAWENRDVDSMAKSERFLTAGQSFVTLQEAIDCAKRERCNFVLREVTYIQTCWRPE